MAAKYNRPPTFIYGGLTQHMGITGNFYRAEKYHQRYCGPLRVAEFRLGALLTVRSRCEAQRLVASAR